MLVICGRDGVELDVAESVEVRAIQGRLKSFLGLPHDAVALVDGVKVSPAHLAQPNSTVEFRKERGHKGVGRVWTPEEYCQLFGLTEADFENQVQQGLKVMQTADGAVRITETAVDSFIGGLDLGALVAVIAKSLEKIATRLPQDQQPEQSNGAAANVQTKLPQPKRKSPYMDCEEAADYLGISAKSLYGQVERRQIIPLRGPRRTYRFTPKMLDEYLRRQQ